MTISDLNIQDDKMIISCEVGIYVQDPGRSWANSAIQYGFDETTLRVYGKQPIFYMIYHTVCMIHTPKLNNLFQADARSVRLEAIETQLEGRQLVDLNGSVYPVQSVDVAKCGIFNVYPEPDYVTFTVGNEEIDVPAIAQIAEEEGRFNIDAVLTLIPSVEHDQKDVSCFSQAFSSARKMGPTNEKNDLSLDVNCKNWNFQFGNLKILRDLLTFFKITQPK